MEADSAGIFKVPHQLLLIISGGIAAYKSLELIRRLKEREIHVRCILTAAGSQFVTPLAVASLSEERVFTDLFSLTDEAEMGHIRLSREADLVVVAPATADLIAKMAHGLADDLASATLLASDKPVLLAPAMNPQMWAHPATRRNVAQLAADGAAFVGPSPGAMACGETGTGRMAEPEAIVEAVLARLGPRERPLLGLKAIVTSGPTFEAIDPVRFIANRSSGRQGHAIASALAAAGADVTLVTGPVALPDPVNVTVVQVESARQMLEACTRRLPADIAVCAAAVADWRPATAAPEKLKKAGQDRPTVLQFVENPDILRALSAEGPGRPALVIGFAAETTDLLMHAGQKLAQKGCDWIMANDVGLNSGTFGGANNTVHLLRRNSATESWPRMTKVAVAQRLVDAIGAHFKGLDAAQANRRENAQILPGRPLSKRSEHPI